MNFLGALRTSHPALSASPKGQQERLEIFSRYSYKGDKNKLYSLIRYNRSGTIGSDNGDFNGHIFRIG